MGNSADELRVHNAKQEQQSSDHDPESNISVASKPENSTPVTSIPVASNPQVFPEGGAQAWLTVAGAAAFLFVSFGWINSIGIFQEYYQDNLLKDYTPSQIAWIPSLMRMLPPLLSSNYVKAKYTNV
jgi:hypothetical protein